MESRGMEGRIHEESGAAGWATGPEASTHLAVSKQYVPLNLQAWERDRPPTSAINKSTRSLQ